MQLKTEKEIDTIRGKMLVAKATQEELTAFLLYVSKLETLVEEASAEDLYGSHGWRYRLGWD
jgi:hypothetical protein